MSYDLMLAGGRGKKLDKKSFSSYFKGRQGYEVGKGQAVYQNEDTGVYFIFDEPADGFVAFNLNYFRPHVFGLEAAIELGAFAEAFDARAVYESGDEGPFDRQKFLRDWNAGNRFGYRAMLSGEEPPDEPVHTWPSKRIRDVWEWNYAIAAEMERMERGGEETFIPTIFAMDVGGELLSVVVWPPRCPMIMPAVDGVLVPLAQAGKASEEVSLVRWEEVGPVVRPYAEKGAAPARYRLVFAEPPSGVEAFLSKRRKASKFNGVGLDQVLDRELVAEAIAER
jgi:hypothetical protein